MRYKTENNMKTAHSGLLKRYAVLFGSATTISQADFVTGFGYCACAQCHKHMQVEVTVRPSLMLRSRYI